MSVDAMGTEKETRALDESEADAALWAKCVAEHGPNVKREFPMMVIPIAKRLEMDELRPHMRASKSTWWNGCRAWTPCFSFRTRG